MASSHPKDFHGPKKYRQETRVQSLGWEDPLEEGMAAHSSTLRWGCALPSPNAPGKAPNHVWREDPGLLSRPCRKRRPSAREDGVSVKLCTEHGDTESDSLCAALKLSFRKCGTQGSQVGLFRPANP